MKKSAVFRQRVGEARGDTNVGTYVEYVALVFQYQNSTVVW